MGAWLLHRKAYSLDHLHKCVSKNESTIKLATWNIFTRQECHYAKHLFSLTGIQLFNHLTYPFIHSQSSSNSPFSLLETNLLELGGQRMLQVHVAL